MSIWLKTPSVIFSLAILAPLVPGYRAYMTTTYFVSGDHAQALTNITTVLTLALVIPIGMASGTILLRLYKVLRTGKSDLTLENKGPFVKMKTYQRRCYEPKRNQSKTC